MEQIATLFGIDIGFFTAGLVSILFVFAVAFIIEAVAKGGIKLAMNLDHDKAPKFLDNLSFVGPIYKKLFNTKKTFFVEENIRWTNLMSEEGYAVSLGNGDYLGVIDGKLVVVEYDGDDFYNERKKVASQVMFFDKKEDLITKIEELSQKEGNEYFLESSDKGLVVKTTGFNFGIVKYAILLDIACYCIFFAPLWFTVLAVSAIGIYISRQGFSYLWSHEFKINKLEKDVEDLKTDKE
ncbi:hypothetical protein [Pseudoalteromonas phage J2-1_QLiu-2017]|nr:hypothetical protein [Pseudoalteromonas phage J2-1_QLiu-2017]